MLTLKCTNCGFSFPVNEGTDTCVCEACDTTWQVAELLSYKNRVAEVVAKVADAFDADKRKKEEAEQRAREAEDLKNETAAYVAKKRADAELARAQSQSKGQTIVINGANASEILESAVNSFVTNDFKGALNSAMKALADDSSNIAAQFIVAFNDAVYNRKMTAFSQYFNKISGAIVSEEDLEHMKKMFITARLKLANYENEVLNFVFDNSTNQPASELCKFVDNFSPNIISSRTSHEFLTEALVETYTKLSAYCSIPKTCFALLGAIENNNESPLKTGQFYLKGTCKKFYDQFVVPVGNIIDNMKSEKNRPQFVKAFSDKETLYRRKTNI